MSRVGDIDSVGCIGRMARYFLLICVVCLQFGASSERPPRINQCRLLFKARTEDGGGSMSYTFRAGASCIESVSLTISDDTIVNATDPRNCENFYKCQGPSCWQCPCPIGETFNPVSLRCDDSNAVCTCEGTTTAQATTTVVTNISITDKKPEQTTRGEKVIPSAEGPGENNQQLNDDQPDSNNGVVIIAVIVVVTVLILVAMILGFCLWQRGVFPLMKKPNMHPSSNDGYLHTLPPQERHVYAEIDERTVGQSGNISEEEARRQFDLQHIYAPPIPSHPPPACVHHPHQTFVLPAGHQQRVYPQFSGYPPQTSSENKDLIKFNSPSMESRGNFNQNNNHNASNGYCGDEYIADNSSYTSCSGCSHCSGLSSQTQLENHEGIDRRTLLRTSMNTPPLAHFYFVSKHHEYI